MSQVTESVFKAWMAAQPELKAVQAANDGSSNAEELERRFKAFELKLYALLGEAQELAAQVGAD